MMPTMPAIHVILQGDYQRRRWSYNQMAQELRTTATTVGRWVSGDSVPNPRWTPAIARFLDLPEQEIRDALDESRDEQQARNDLQTQVSVMRAEQREMNARYAELERVVRELLAVVEDLRRRLPSNGPN